MFSGLSIRWKVLLPMGLIVVIMLLQVYLVIDMNRMQQEDAVSVNVAGRQRMLSQKMTKETLNFIYSQDSSHAQEQVNTINTFEQSLDALMSGGDLTVSGRDVTLKASQNQEIIGMLEDAAQYWQQVKPLYTGAIDSQTNGDFDVNELNEVSKQILTKFDTLTGMYETASAMTIAKYMNLIYIGLGIYLIAMIFTLVFMQRKVIKPIVSLRDTAAKIADGDLS